MSVPKSFILSKDSVKLLLIIKFSCFPLINCNFLGFTIMQLFANHFIEHSDVFSKFLINSCKSLQKAGMVLPSENSCKLAVLDQKKR